MRQKTTVLRFLALALVALLCSCRPEASGPGNLRILLSNDDGIDAPGLKALYEKLRPLGDVTVAAPLKNSSGVSHSIATEAPIRVEESAARGKKWYAIDAFPATCVRFALENLLTEKPDIVVSGINRGDNTGLVTFFSATVAVARQAAFAGIPAIAVNLERGEEADLENAAAFTAQLVREVGTKGLKAGVFLNVNFPALPKSRIKGVKITSQDLRNPIQFYEKRVGQDGEPYYWPGYKRLAPEDEKTDIGALGAGYITITPLQIDQTARPELKAMESWAVAKGKD
jgi:5'-nucleotidase